jgi:hypothetical protein
VHAKVEDLKQFTLGQLGSSEAATIETHLLECRSCRKALAELTTGPSRPATERRCEIRVETESPARIKALDPLTSIGPSSNGLVLNTSSKGLKLKAPRAFFPGAVVQIRFQDRSVLGKVKYCNPSGDEFDIGVELKEDL